MSYGRSVYVADGADPDQVRAALGRLHLPDAVQVDVEPSEEYVGYAIAIDLQGPQPVVDELAPKVAAELTAALPALSFRTERNIVSGDARGREQSP